MALEPVEAVESFFGEVELSQDGEALEAAV